MKHNLKIINTRNDIFHHNSESPIGLLNIGLVH